MLDAKAHAEYLRAYAKHADHPNAPAICRWARAEVERMVPEPILPAKESVKPRDSLTLDLFD